MRSIMKHAFSQVPAANIPRSVFNRSFSRHSTFDAGFLVPIFVDEALPGDTMSVRLNAFARLSTPLVPLMDYMTLTTFFFAIPLRLIWENFPKFMGEQTDPGDSTDYLTPLSQSPGAGGYAIHSLHDYMGLPTGVGGLAHVNLPLRSYNLTYNEWFRDENLQDSVVVDRDDGPDTYSDYVLLRRGKRHDYFTSCLPWPQKGDAVTIPLGTEAPIRGRLNGSTVDDRIYIKGTGNIGVQKTGTAAGATAPLDSDWSVNPAGTNEQIKWQQPLDGTGTYGGYNFADLSEATAATINALRQAFQIQRLYERDARGGTRYTEIIRAHFGVISPDARLQRPEYLGGGSSPVNIHPVPQTSATGGTGTPQGNLAAMGTVSTSGHGFTKSFTEHCIVLGLACVDADLTYQQGLNRMWSRRTRWDFFWPALAHIGEQAVYNKEIFATGNAGDEDVFGYQERYGEYRYKPSEITGLFRSNASGTLDMWHLSEDFATTPTLNAAFIVSNPPIDRTIATPTEPHFKFHGYFNFRHARPIPVFGVPGNLDRF